MAKGPCSSPQGPYFLGTSLPLPQLRREHDLPRLRALGPDEAVVSLGNAPGDGEPHTEAAVGGVKIDLIEQQSNKDHTGFVPYTGDKVLMPIVGSAQGEKYPNGQPKAANYIDKVVTIQNTGKSAAWIRAYYAVPSDLDDGYETFNAGANILHGNFGNKIVDGTVYTTFGAEWNWMHDGKWNYFETTMDGVNYNVYFADYYQPVAANETTEQLICGVYLDKNVDMKDGKYIDTRYPNADLSILEGTVKYPVFAVAVQAEGFDTAAAAMDAAFGANYNPWGGTATNWQ